MARRRLARRLADPRPEQLGLAELPAAGLALDREGRAERRAAGRAAVEQLAAAAGHSGGSSASNSSNQRRAAPQRRHTALQCPSTFRRSSREPVRGLAHPRRPTLARRLSTTSLVASPSPYGIVETVDRLAAVAEARGMSRATPASTTAPRPGRSGWSSRTTSSTLAGDPRIGTLLIQGERRGLRSCRCACSSGSRPAGTHVGVPRPGGDRRRVPARRPHATSSSACAPGSRSSVAEATA